MKVVLRRGIADDAAAIASIRRIALFSALPHLPKLHSLDEDLTYFRDRVLSECSVWVAEEHVPVAFIAFTDTVVLHLYVHPAHQHRGIGTVLLAKAMDEHKPLQLWTFQRNTNALRFYAARGFQEVERTDGSGNEEREPDVLLRKS